MFDRSFLPDRSGLDHAVDLLASPPDGGGSDTLPESLPETGMGEMAALDSLAPLVLGGARKLGAPEAFAHMDPPTPWIAWATTLWNASQNQNLLHPDVAPVARDLEARVIAWLAPFFGMDGGHMLPGSTLANITALWAARECRGIRRVIGSEAAHVSVKKAAHLLGLDYLPVASDAAGRLTVSALPDRLDDAALVLTAGTTNAGAIDDLGACGAAAWTHVDAAWAGPLRFSERYADRLDGIEAADSVAVSAHKWLFQPKESALILFRETETAHTALSFGGAYLAAPNIGILGSHGAVAVPLLATLLAWGRTGLAERIDRTMGFADVLVERLTSHGGVDVFGAQESGVVLWRPAGASDLQPIFERLPVGLASRTRIGEVDWVRQVAANPCADMDRVWAAVAAALD
ncbi:MAG: pyridoxal-dependent decarboxylase [Pseudomonadota bacterium]